jgi:hypothetical protein
VVGVGAEVGAGVVVGVGVTSSCPPQLISGINSISVNTKAIHLKASWYLVISESPLQSDVQCTNAVLTMIWRDDINADDENRQGDIKHSLLLYPSDNAPNIQPP